MCDRQRPRASQGAPLGKEPEMPLWVCPAIRSRRGLQRAFPRSETGRGAPLGAGGNRDRVNTSVPPGQLRHRQGTHFLWLSTRDHASASLRGRGRGRERDASLTRSYEWPSRGLTARGSSATFPPAAETRTLTASTRLPAPAAAAVLPALLRVTPGSQARAPGHGTRNPPPGDCGSGNPRWGSPRTTRRPEPPHRKLIST